MLGPVFVETACGQPNSLALLDFRARHVFTGNDGGVAGMKKLKGVTLAAAAAAAAAILVPLYGDPRRSPVTHPEWAHMLLRALDMESVLVPGSGASLAFESLSWRTSVGIAPDKPFRSVGVELVAGPPRFLRANAGAPGEIAYRLAIPRAGDYRVRLKLGNVQGSDLAPGVGLELTPDGETAPVRSLTLAPTVLTETDGIFLRPGLYALSVALPSGLSLEAIEVVPPCVNSIEPKGGWQRTAIAQTGDVAVTTLKALDVEHELPPAAAPIEVPGLAFQPTAARTLKASLKGGLEGFWLQADAGGLQAVTHVNLPEPGLYTVYGYGLSGGGQSWMADSCLKTVVCPAAASPETPLWRPIMTAEFSAGRHSFAMTLANGAALQRLKIERKKDGIADYLGTLARLGLDLGDQGPIPRARAIDAMNFIRTKRREPGLARCGEVLLPSSTLVAGLAIPAGSTLTTGAAPPAPGPGAVPLVPLPGPSPQPGPSASPAPASPSPAPVTSPSPGPSASPSPASSPSPSPSPSIGPPPTTLVQPPASPVKE